MATSKQQIRWWLEEGLKRKATHVIVACDSYDHEDYPVFVNPNMDVRQIYSEYDGKNMQRVMEVYNLSMDLDEQLAAPHRVMNFEATPKNITLKDMDGAVSFLFIS